MEIVREMEMGREMEMKEIKMGTDMRGDKMGREMEIVRKLELGREMEMKEIKMGKEMETRGDKDG
jgi:hypothetical protein